MSASPASDRLSIREFAKRAVCDEKQVRRAIEKGLLTKGDDGFLSADHVSGQWRKPNRRGIVKIAADNAAKARTVRPARTTLAETPEQAAERIVTEAGGLLSLEEALKLKENYLGRIKQLEYDQRAGAVHNSATCATIVGQEYARVRTKLLAIPSEQAPALFRCQTVAEIEDALRGAVVEALEALIRDEQPSG